MEVAYNSFAAVYDSFMDDVPYKEWASYLLSLLREYGCKEGILLDMGCGTGILTELLAQAGYDMIGIDNSPEMLQKAMKRREESGHDILYLLQDMREFELYGTVAGAVSICDSMNYILSVEELIEVFRLVNNYLDPGGIFIFDLNTLYKYQSVIGDATIAESRQEAACIWENYFDEESRINEYDLTLFIRGEDGRFDRHVETHYQRAYELWEIQDALKKAGMEFVTAYDGFTRQQPGPESQRIYVIARERGKEPKDV